VRTTKWLIAAFGLVSGLSVFGCSSSPTDTTPSCPKFDYSTYTKASSPTLADVQPIIAVSCALSVTCHGSQGATMAQHEPQLGPAQMATPPDAATLAAIKAAIVGVNSKEAPSLQLVQAGDTSKSYLMIKLEGSQNCSGLNCMPVASVGTGVMSTGCGSQMPANATSPTGAGGSPLDPADSSKIRDWIAAGAN
jgi:hypothetical protein